MQQDAKLCSNHSTLCDLRTTPQLTVVSVLKDTEPVTPARMHPRVVINSGFQPMERCCHRGAKFVCAVPVVKRSQTALTSQSRRVHNLSVLKLK